MNPFPRPLSHKDLEIEKEGRFATLFQEGSRDRPLIVTVSSPRATPFPDRPDV
jgi:hypothetical protein